MLDARVRDNKVLAQLEVSNGHADESTRSTRVQLTVHDGLVVAPPRARRPRLAVMIKMLVTTSCPTTTPSCRTCGNCGTHGVDKLVRLVEVADDQALHRTRFLGSPTLRSSGRDIEPGADDRGNYGLHWPDLQHAPGPGRHTQRVR